MTSLTHAARRAAGSTWSALVLAQVVLLTASRLLIARVRDTEPSSDAGFTTAEYVIGLVIGIPAVVVIATLLWNHFKSDAHTVVNTK
jgi:hypothetical protein